MFGDQGGWLFVAIDILGVLLLGAALFYGVSMWRSRRTDPTTERLSREATQRMYHHEDAEAEAAAEGRPEDARRAEPRPAVDSVARSS